MPCTASRDCRASSTSATTAWWRRIEYEPIAGAPGKRGFDTFLKAFDAGILVRAAGDITALSPPLIIEKNQIDELIGTLGKVIKAQ